LRLTAINRSIQLVRKVAGCLIISELQCNDVVPLAFSHMRSRYHADCGIREDVAPYAVDNEQATALWNVPR
jgi:hypothetical protein